MVRLTPPDPRKLLPSRADPEHRGRRKELEKKHGYGYTEPLLLAMLGVGLVWNIENQVKKHEERKEGEEKEEKERDERQRKKREHQIRSGTWDPERRDRGRDRAGSRSEKAGRDSRSRHPEGDRGSRSRYRDDYDRDGVPVPPQVLEYRAQEYRGYRDQYRDYHPDARYEDRRDGSVRRSSRRDSF